MPHCTPRIPQKQLLIEMAALVRNYSMKYCHDSDFLELFFSKAKNMYLILDHTDFPSKAEL